MEQLVWDPIYTADETTAIDLVFEAVDDLFLSDNLRSLDREITRIDVFRARVSVTLSVLTATLPFSQMLKSRVALVGRLRERNLSRTGLLLMKSFDCFKDWNKNVFVGVNLSLRK